ncbi:hypothetical protein [Nonomuraea sp. NPDC005650]|uniref:hypothetical protein n=1 Tax=Nonomuraea sp. NPDC005650 TaxID=3157045 RepID=UPI0033B2E2DC
MTEARGRGGTFYDPVSRLGGQGPFRQPEIEVLVRDVERWADGPRDDDMAILAILAITRRAGEPAP